MPNLLRLFGSLTVILSCAAIIATFTLGIRLSSLSAGQPNYPVLILIAVAYALTGTAVTVIFFALAEIVERLRAVQKHTDILERNENIRVLKQGLIRQSP